MRIPRGAHLSHSFWTKGQIEEKPSVQYFSQFGEDEYANAHFFRNMTNGVYVELGALDGIALSNTMFYSQQLGWKGVLIEASNHYEALTQNRPDDVCVHAAVCDNSTDIHFISEHAVGGIYEFMSQEFRQRWHPNIDLASVPVVACLPLTLILSKAGIRHIDFFSLDVENAELQVLSSLNFALISISVLVVEADGTNPAKDAAVISLLQANGFLYHGHVNNNDWFVHQSFSATPR